MNQDSTNLKGKRQLSERWNIIMTKPETKGKGQMIKCICGSDDILIQKTYDEVWYSVTEKECGNCGRLYTELWKPISWELIEKE